MEAFSASFQAVLQYLALPAESQLTIGAVIVPERSSRTAHEFKEVENGLVALALSYADLLQPFSSSDDYRPPDSETILEALPPAAKYHACNRSNFRGRLNAGVGEPLRPQRLQINQTRRARALGRSQARVSSAVDTKLVTTLQQKAEDFVNKSAEQTDRFLTRIAESEALIQPEDRQGLRQLAATLKDVVAIGRDTFGLSRDDSQSHCLVNLAFLQSFDPISSQSPDVSAADAWLTSDRTRRILRRREREDRSVATQQISEVRHAESVLRRIGIEDRQSTRT